MPGCLSSCIGRIVGLILLVALLAAAWLWGPRLFPGYLGFLDREAASEEDVPSPELAEQTLDRIETFRAGQGSERLMLGGPQLSSVLRYSLPGILPPGVMEPMVDLRDGKMHLSARVAVSAFPDLPSLRDVVGMLPDTVDIDMHGGLIPHDDEHAAFLVERIYAMRIPLPGRFIPQILASLGRSDSQGLPREAMLIPLPGGLRSVYLLKDSLVLVSDR